MKYFRILIILLLLTSGEGFKCSFSQPPHTTICWGVSILCQLEHFFIDNPEKMTNFHMISLGEDEMKNQICNIIRDFAILDTALLPTTCK